MSISNASWRRLLVLPVSAPLGPLGPVATLHYPYLPHHSLHAVYATRMHHGNLMTAVHYGDALEPGSLAHAAGSRRGASKWWGLGAEMTLAGTERCGDRWETHFHAKTLLGLAHATLRVVQVLMGSEPIKYRVRKTVFVHSPANRWESVTQWWGTEECHSCATYTAARLQLRRWDCLESVLQCRCPPPGICEA